MARIFQTNELYRTHLDEYAEKWQNLAKFRRENGILEVRFHCEGGTWRWNHAVHGALASLFNDLTHDPETECIIITGTGDVYLNEFDKASLEEQRAVGMGQHILYDQWWMAQTLMPSALMDIPVPIVGAVNGPATIHPETAFLSDIVICAEGAHLWDRHYTGVGIVPGDGGNIFFRELLGKNRARATLYMGKKVLAPELLELGAVAEVLPSDKLLDRAWEIAETVLMSVSRIQRRLSREILMQPWREVYAKEIRASMAHECWACADTWPGQDPKTDGLAPDPMQATAN